MSSTVRVADEPVDVIDVTPDTLSKSTVEAPREVKTIDSTLVIDAGVTETITVAVSVSDPSPPLMVSPEFSV